MMTPKELRKINKTDENEPDLLPHNMPLRTILNKFAQKLLWIMHVMENHGLVAFDSEKKEYYDLKEVEMKNE